MTDNSQIDSLQERNQQSLNNISQLQQQEKELYSSLDDVNLSADQKQQIINKINEISQIRMNLYSNLRDLYANYQVNVSSSRSTLDQSKAAIDILENELNNAKIKMNLIKDEKYNKLRLVEINTYYGKRYNAHASIMKIIVLTCIPIILLSILYNKQILSPTIYSVLSALSFIIGSVFLIIKLIDISNRDTMNWDEYNWYFNKNDAPDQDSASSSSSSNPWNTTAIPCIGSACCNENSTYDSTQNLCIPKDTTTTEGFASTRRFY
jgi:hypothetical protein